MTRQERAGYLRDLFEQARAEALEEARAFVRLCGRADTTPKDIEAYGNDLVMAAGRVAGFAHLLEAERARRAA